MLAKQPPIWILALPSICGSLHRFFFRAAECLIYVPAGCRRSPLPQSNPYPEGEDQTSYPSPSPIHHLCRGSQCPSQLCTHGQICGFQRPVRPSLVAQLVKNPPAMQETRFDSWVGKIPWRREWLSIPVFWPGESNELYSPCVIKSWTWLSDFHRPVKLPPKPTEKCRILPRKAIWEREKRKL